MDEANVVFTGIVLVLCVLGVVWCLCTYKR